MSTESLYQQSFYEVADNERSDFLPSVEFTRGGIGLKRTLNIVEKHLGTNRGNGDTVMGSYPQIAPYEMALWLQNKFRKEHGLNYFSPYGYPGTIMVCYG